MFCVHTRCLHCREFDRLLVAVHVTRSRLCLPLCHFAGSRTGTIYRFLDCKVFSIGMSKRSHFLAIAGSFWNFAVTAKPKLALRLSARAPNPSAVGPFPTFRGLQPPPAPIVYAFVHCLLCHLSVYLTLLGL